MCSFNFILDLFLHNAGKNVNTKVSKKVPARSPSLDAGGPVPVLRGSLERRRAADRTCIQFLSVILEIDFFVTLGAVVGSSSRSFTSFVHTHSFLFYNSSALSIHTICAKYTKKNRLSAAFLWNEHMHYSVIGSVSSAAGTSCSAGCSSSEGTCSSTPVSSSAGGVCTSTSSISNPAGIFSTSLSLRSTSKPF